MDRDELNNLYFEWMYRLVCGSKPNSRNNSYRKLLMHLHTAEFIYIIGMDGNRYEDGIELRYRFGRENSYHSSMIASYLDTRPCSVLEMLIALSIRCEEQIMDDSDIGDRTSQWFWDMVENLNLKVMCDSKYDREYVDGIISKFLNRQYQRNGAGGLFTVENCPYDLRSVEIWYQMCWYLDYILAKGD